MPRYKLSDADRKKISHVKRECPCIKKSLLAYIFNISPSRVGEVLREDNPTPARKAAEKWIDDVCGGDE